MLRYQRSPNRKQIMENNKEEKHKKYAGEKKPSMKRRCDAHDYRDRGIYMITMAIEGRLPLLGSVVGNPDATNCEEKARVVLTPLGEKVKDCWEKIQQYHPVVEPMKLCIMPDHIHGLLFVHDKMEKHLGDVVMGFKIGTRKAARELGVLPSAARDSSAALVAQPTQQPAGNNQQQPGHQQQPAGNNQQLPGHQQQPAGNNQQQPGHQQQPSTRQAGTTGAVPYAALPAQPQSPPPSRHTAIGRSHGQLWEPGYNDRLLRQEGQLQRMADYMDDNPRRLLLKRLHPEYFTVLGTLTVAGMTMQAMGNRFLLDNPVKLQVQCSRHLYENEIAERQANFIQAGHEGVVLVSPCISPGESQIATAALNEGIALIVLLLKGFSPTFKPAPRYLQACAEGRLLMLAPFPWQNEKITNMRQRCLQLNDMAARICEAH